MRLKSVFLATTAVALLAGAGTAQAGDLYVSVFGGANFLADDNGIWETGEGVWSSDADTGFVLGGAIGTHLDKWAQGLRVEVETSYRRNDVNGSWTETGGYSTGELHGNLSTFAIMANSWYDFDIGAKATPYVGGGVGWARMHADFAQTGDETSSSATDQSGFAWQLGAGFNYTVSADVNLGLGYRYFHGPSYHISLEGTDDGVLHNDNHVVQVSLTIGIN